ncbi:MAG: MotA/TolQ/ExbB proton channel family protein [Chthoniobacterales bacterium]|jgi:biopolymer transport protein ExbB|nr:MotA/TolQ/ExbB proton channel family protein [Chthoniobacterales bacterium]
MLELMQKGGPVMWVILALSIVGLAVFLERLVYLHRAQVRVGEFLRGLANLVREDRTDEVRRQCLATPGPVARVVLSAVLARDCPRAELRDIVQEAGQLEVPRLERHLSLLGGISYAAPLLGLLGTVLGLLEAFYLVSTQGGYATVADLSGAVYQSLISAAAGLAVAIPALIGAGYINARVQDLVHDMERAGIEMVNLLKNKTLPVAEILAMDAEPADEA